MNPTTESLLLKARKLLANAATALKVGLNEDAGRNTYLAGYHAACALLFAKEGNRFVACCESAIDAL